MHISKSSARLLISLLLALHTTLASAEGATEAAASEGLLIDGSSTVYPLTREAIKRFQRARPGHPINVEFSGTTAGFRRFCAGETDINDASREMNAEEQAECAKNDVRYRQIPLAMDSIAVVAHPSNHWAKDITVDELKALWAPDAEGRVTRWNQIRPEWPDRPVKLFGRGQDSGTYDVFTREIVGATHRSRQDYTASEDEEQLANGIAAEPDALGFFGIGAYHRHWDELKLLAVDNGNGPVYPTLATVSEGRYQPLTRPLFVYLNEESLQRKPITRAFVEHYLQGLPGWIHFTGYMPLSAEQYERSLAILQNSPEQPSPEPN
ncbi:PstS family phosphate ABC transporter substrate-binding protein [Stutzerimonas zhaodongensis]|jgi:phosphate transport system substrate-binding protein|uniref:PstS family phosphate ABC transporter substrate-binding protein n=1 Tax=Stutzerimonas zhaodongensis TaxID=1176257 RepID=UPI001F4EB9C7|nr:PstS family phosphate ABC transporter substrate-binding protein [Stutzerimonas zhaodongensis]UNG17412.1 PstS family phosphate ABC transporter substrate-binding protein [Stutzerimonas zhaodongensis]